MKNARGSNTISILSALLNEVGPRSVFGKRLAAWLLGDGEFGYGVNAKGTPLEPKLAKAWSALEGRDYTSAYGPATVLRTPIGSWGAAHEAGIGCLISYGRARNEDDALNFLLSACHARLSLSPECGERMVEAARDGSPELAMWILAWMGRKTER